MNCREKEEPTTARPSPAPKRVAGGIIVKSKKKKKKKIRHNAGAGASIAPSVSVSSRVPSILSSVPNHSSEEDSRKSEQPTSKNQSSEFDDNDDDFDNEELFDAPSDAMMCLQTYTRSSSSVGGLMAETCAYCPIYSYEGGGSNSNSNNNGGTRRCTSSHAAPFLPRHVLLHLLDPSTSNNSSSSSCANVSTRTHVEQEIKQLASSNKIRLLQLHGTAASSSAGWKGDGNDDEDVALMETAAYETAAEMALQSYFQGGQSETLMYTYRVEMVHTWFACMLLPYFAGRIWFSSGSLETFYEYAIAISHQTQKNDNMITTATNGSTATATATATATLSSPRVKQYTMTQMKGMIQQLEHAGLLLPRRGVGATAAGGGDGYWFSLPGIGKASKSIVDGRTNLLRRLKSSYYKEKKRSVLEQEIGRVKRQDHPTSSSSSSGTTTSSGTKRKLEQSGKFVVLDLLAKGWVSVHKTSTGDQRIRLVE